MALSGDDRLDLAALIQMRDSQRALIATEEERLAKINADITEILDRNETKKVTVAGKVVELVSQLNWNSFDADAVSKEYPIMEYPDLYEPTYRSTKLGLNKRAGLELSDSRLIARFTPLRTFVRVSDVRKPSKGRKNWSRL